MKKKKLYFGKNRPKHLRNKGRVVFVPVWHYLHRDVLRMLSIVKDRPAADLEPLLGTVIGRNYYEKAVVVDDGVLSQFDPMVMRQVAAEKPWIDTNDLFISDRVNLFGLWFFKLEAKPEVIHGLTGHIWITVPSIADKNVFQLVEDLGEQEYRYDVDYGASEAVITHNLVLLSEVLEDWMEEHLVVEIADDGGVRYLTDDGVGIIPEGH